MPRTADGKPDLTAPAPRTPDGKPDLSGIWQRPRGAMPSTGGTDGIGDGTDVRFQPSAEALYKERGDNNGKGMPSERCLPHGITKAFSVPEPFKIVQTPGLILILHEEFNHHRQIFTDRRNTAARRAPASFGYSRGTWDGDTLVVDTTGFNDQTWLNEEGAPHSDALHLVEHIRPMPRNQFLEYKVTAEDPKVLAHPYTYIRYYKKLETEVMDDPCEDQH